MKTFYPAYQNYPKDWQADQKAQSLSYEHFGMYHKLLDAMWIESKDQCSCPKDIKAIAAILKIDIGRAQEFIHALQHTPFGAILKEKGSKYISKRLNRERNKMQQYSRRMSDAGRKGAKKRYGHKEKPKRTPEDIERMFAQLRGVYQKPFNYQGAHHQFVRRNGVWVCELDSKVQNAEIQISNWRVNNTDKYKAFLQYLEG